MGWLREAIVAIYRDQNELGKITQVELARKLKCTKGQINHLLSGKSRLNEDNLIGIMNALGIRPSDLDIAASSDAKTFRLCMMLRDLLSAGEPWEAAIITSIESMHASLSTAQKASIRDSIESRTEVRVRRPRRAVGE